MFDRNRNKPQSTPKKEEIRNVPSAPSLGNPPSAPSSHSSAVIGPGIEISGDVTASADLVINGKINGSVVQSSHSVEIGESGQVNARVRAKMVKVSGEVRGDILGNEKVLITRTGRALGNISAPRVQLDDGALFKGSIDMTPPEAAKPAAPAPAKKAEAKAPVAPAKKAEAKTASADASATKESERKEPSLTLKSG